jgi:hypothetical protein
LSFEFWEDLKGKGRREKGKGRREKGKGRREKGKEMSFEL